MKRTSNTLFLESHGSVTPLPWVNNQPVFDGFAEPTLSVLRLTWQEFLTSGKQLEIIPDPAPITNPPGWDGLLRAILNGALYPLYARLTAASFADPTTATPESNANTSNIAAASGKLNQAVQVTQHESAVAAAMNLLLTTSNYSFTAEEKTLWNATIASLGFSAVMELQ